MEQRTLEWHRARLGKFTGSRVGDLMVRGRAKGEPFGGTAMSYIRSVAAQRLLRPSIVEDDALFADYLDVTGTTTKAMRWGTDYEGYARELYMAVTGNEVAEAGSVTHSVLECLAASPDGIVTDRDGSEGVLEIKCAADARFVELCGVTCADALKAAAPGYYWQVMAEMACADTEWCDFVVYNPYMLKPIHITRLGRDNAAVGEMLERVGLAENVVESLINQV